MSAPAAPRARDAASAGAAAERAQQRERGGGGEDANTGMGTDTRADRDKERGESGQLGQRGRRTQGWRRKLSQPEVQIRVNEAWDRQLETDGGTRQLEFNGEIITRRRSKEGGA